MNHVLTAGLSGTEISGAVLGGVGVLLLIGTLLFKMLRYRTSPDENFSFADFSLARYQPMLHLLSGEDLDFLASQPGCRPAILNRLRRDRRRIFRMYLRELAGDFQALHAAARRMAATSPEEHADLIPGLLRQQASFWFALAAIEVRLSIPHFGGVDVRELIASVEAVRLDVARLAA